MNKLELISALKNDDITIEQIKELMKKTNAKLYINFRKNLNHGFPRRFTET